MKKRYKPVLLSMLVLALLACFSGIAAAGQTRVVTGTLHEVSDPQPRSPRWEVQLDQPLMVGDSVLTTVEVDAGDTDLTALAGQKVTATGSFVQWKTKERGSFIVLESCEVGPLK